MYLKALEIQGFKSFPEKTRLSFERDITVIVGPNGSGKSNISDALLWVMGEQKSRMLRGGKMEDVIFGGTEKRGAMGFAQVTLVLDNTKRVVSLDADEVSIARRYYRSGESEYYVNREQVRLRDVLELLMDTGLGVDGYSIIGQGRISEIVSAKSTDRREIFEEAAGISRFRHRKDESERKLERTEENLLRIGDKISELEYQVEPLRRQSETAQKYLLLRDELRVNEVSLWMADLDRLQEQSEQLRGDCERAKSECAAARSEQERLYAESERLSERMHAADLEAEEQRRILRDTENAAATAENEAAVLRTNIENNKETLVKMARELGEETDRANSLLRQVEEHRNRITAIGTERREREEELSNLLRRAEEQRSHMDENTRALSDLLEREAELGGTLSSNDTALGMLSETVAAIDERVSHADEEQRHAEEKNEAAAAALTAAKKERAAAREQEQSASNVIAGHTMLMAGREKTVAELLEKRESLSRELYESTARIRVLTDLERQMEGVSRASKAIVQESARGVLRGIHGTVGQKMRVRDEYALAVETALGGSMGNIIVDTQNDAKAAIEYLKRRDIGRATFMPIDTVRPHRLRDEPRGEEGYIGLASDLTETEPEYRAIIDNLLGNTAVAEDMTAAIAIARRHKNSIRIVTLDGQLVNAGGSMTGGSAARGTGLLSRANELRRLESGKTALEEALAKATQQHAEAERELQKARYELDRAKEEQAAARETVARQEGLCNQAQLLFDASEEALDNLDEELRGASARKKESVERMETLRRESEDVRRELSEIAEKKESESATARELERRRRESDEAVSALRATLASLDAEKSSVYLTIDQLNALHADITGKSDRSRDAAEVIRTRNAELEELLDTVQQRLSALRTQAETEQKTIAALTANRLELEGRRDAVDRSAKARNDDVLEREKTAAALEQKKYAAELEERQLIDKLWDNYELSRSEAQKVRREIESIPKATRQVSELRRSMSSLGSVNLGAIEEYKRVSERYEFLTGQRDDVQKARDEILGIINELTSQMEDIFRREIVEIDAAFRSIFSELFGGGKAAVSLEDENDVLNCGIDIRIQPPGKAVSNISLLSGGEKALVAIALYFAIMRVRPTPFCVMDEIESALDEDNVSRFASYMRRMCEKTQFIAITHRRGTMEEADQLYGVTMQEKGVSTVLAMDMDEALQTIS